MLYEFLVLFLYCFFSVRRFSSSSFLDEREWASVCVALIFFSSLSQSLSISISIFYSYFDAAAAAAAAAVVVGDGRVLLPLCVSKFLISYVFLHYMFHSRFAKQITQTNSKFLKRQNKGAQFIKRQEFFSEAQQTLQFIFALGLSSSATFNSLCLFRTLSPSQEVCVCVLYL